MTKNITMLGAGVWGKAIAKVLSSCGHNVRLWHYKKDDLSKFNNYELEVFHDDISSIKDEYLFVSLPTQSIKKHLEGIDISGKKVVILSKGINLETLERSSEIIDANLFTLYGPTHSNEINSKQLSSMVVSSDHDTKEIVELFSSCEFIKIIQDNDIKTAEYFAAFKNSFAIAYGIVSLLDSKNSSSAFFSFICSEYSKLIEAMGCDASKIMLPHGIGDLLVTCRQGRNRSFGELIGKGLTVSQAKEKIGMVVEGYYTNRAIKKISDKKNIELTINSLLYSILSEGENPNKILSVFK